MRPPNHGRGLNENKVGSETALARDWGWLTTETTPNHTKFGNVVYGDGHVSSEQGSDNWGSATNSDGTFKVKVSEQ